MSLTLRLTCLRLGCLLAVLISSMLLLHYVDPNSSGFCGARSGCEAVRVQAPRPFGMPHFMPLLGVVAYVGLFWLSFMPRQGRILSWLAAGGGLIGVLLLAHQVFIINSWCGLCISVDLLAVGVGFIAWQRTPEPPREPFRGWGWAGLFALAINTPVLWQQVEPPATPAAWPGPPPKPGTLEIVHFVDFQCRHCRELHSTLERALHELQLSAHHRWFHFPLSIHPLAEDAARAAICAESLGVGDAMARRLLELPLQANVWLKHAATLGLQPNEFETCLHSEPTSRTLEHHRRLYRETQAQGLPLTFVGSEKLHGAVPRDAVIAAIDRATSRVRLQLPGWLFASLSGAFAAGWLFLARSRPRSAASAAASTEARTS